MGCDIHIYREKFADGRWQSIDKWSDKYGDGLDVCYPDQCYEGRNYDLFGALAKGVRREFPFSFEPRGLPLAMDDRLRGVVERWADDGHNHSYLYLHELREFQEWAKSNTLPISGMMHREQWERLQRSIAAGEPDWEGIYPYCQWGSSPELVDFQVDVPVSFAVGECISTIVNSFDGADGESHRIVFWFDN